MNSGSYLLIILSFLAVATAATAATRGPRLGGYQPLKNLNDPEVVEIANYAVTEHNNKDGTHLKYVKIVKGESQVVAGTNYRLVITANDGSNSHDYEALVYDRPWDKFRSLVSFKAL